MNTNHQVSFVHFSPGNIFLKRLLRRNHEQSQSGHHASPSACAIHLVPAGGCRKRLHKIKYPHLLHVHLPLPGAWSWPQLQIPGWKADRTQNAENDSWKILHEWNSLSSPGHSAEALARSRLKCFLKWKTRWSGVGSSLRWLAVLQSSLLLSQAPIWRSSAACHPIALLCKNSCQLTLPAAWCKWRWRTSRCFPPKKCRSLAAGTAKWSEATSCFGFQPRPARSTGRSVQAKRKS